MGKGGERRKEKEGEGEMGKPRGPLHKLLLNHHSSIHTPIHISQCQVLTLKEAAAAAGRWSVESRGSVSL